MKHINKVHVIRDSIAKIVVMLVSKRVKVTQRGAKAYVAYNKVTNAVEYVNIPYLPDDASEDFIAAVQGFLDHEVGHVLFTDPTVPVDAYKVSQEVGSMANVMEDVYIERKMQEAFAGSVKNLEAVRQFYLYKVSGAKLQEALKAGDIEMARGYAIVTAMRAWGGQISAQDYIKAPEIAELIAPVAAKIGPTLIARIPKCNSSRECLALAKDIVEALNKSKPPAPPPPPPPAAPPAPSPKSEKGEKGEGEPSDNGEKGEGDEGKTSTKKDDSGKERDEKSKADELKQDDTEDAEQPPAKGDGEGKGSGPEQEDEDDAAGDEPQDAESGAGAEPEGGPEQEDESAGGAGDDETEDEQESGAGAAGGDEGQPEDGPGEGAEEAAPAGAGSAQEDDREQGESAPPSGDEGEPGGGGSFEGEAEPEMPEETFGHLFDKDYDFDKDIGEALTNVAAKEISHTDYRIYSTEWDSVEPGPKCSDPASVQVLEDAVAGSIGVMQKQLERAMAAQARKTWNPAQRKGRIHPGGLFKTATGDDRVFRTRTETRAKNTAVELLVDCSGSMHHQNRIKMAGIAAYAISCVLERLRVQHEIMGFTTRACREMMAAIEADRVPGMYGTWSRYEALYHPVFKGFHERLSSDVKQRIASMVELPRWCRNNVDGEAVQLAGHRLLQQTAERHVLMVLSDGDPACTPSCGALRGHLQKVVKQLQANKVEVIGIGIQSYAVKSFYDKYVVLDDLDNLPTTVMGQITKLLLS